MADEQGAKSFWLTLPGALTAAATFLTAVTGLMVTLNQIGFFAKTQPTAVPIATPSPAPVTGEPLTKSPVEPPVTHVTPRPSGNGGPRDALAGVWLNSLIDPRNGQPESRLVISRLPGGARILQGWGNCTPRECDWGAAPLEVTPGASRTDLMGWHATTKLVHVVPNKNREDVTYLTLDGTGAPATLTVRRRFESSINHQLTTRIERVATYTRHAAGAAP